MIPYRTVYVDADSDVQRLMALSIPVINDWQEEFGCSITVSFLLNGAVRTFMTGGYSKDDILSIVSRTYDLNEALNETVGTA